MMLFLRIVLIFFVLICAIYLFAAFSLKNNNSKTFTGAVLGGTLVKVFMAGGLFYLFFIAGNRETDLSKLMIVLIFLILYVVYSSVLYFFLLKLNKSYQAR